MNSNRTIYLISGPLGVGKSTVSKELSQKLKNSVLIVGDDIMFMIKKGCEPEWEEWLQLTWANIVSLTRNFLQYNYQIVIDYVVESELKWFCEQLSDLNVSIKYVVLRADEEKLRERLQLRGDDYLIKRSIPLLEKLENTPENQGYLYDATIKLPSQIADDIIHNNVFEII